jgi:hypothetical protein
MFITKIHLPRRTVLKALGVTVGLPLLDAMIPAATALATTVAAPRPRMTFVYFPHGAVMDQWTPRTEGPDFELPPILAPLAPFQKQLTVVSGCENQAVAGTALHATTPGTWLSCVVPRVGHDPCAGVTVDQVAAEKIGYDTPLRSLEVGTEEQGGEGSWDRKYGAGYGKTISFRTPTTPLPTEHDPHRLFQLLVGQSAALAAVPERSVLDLVRRPAADLRRGLGRHDRAMLDDYLLGVREIERRVQSYRPTDPFHEHIELMFDLIVLAYQANLTRVATFMMAAEVSTRSHPALGIDADIHSLSHHQNNPEKLARLAQVQAFHTRLFAGFVRRLAQMPDGDGSMLDHSIVLYGSNMGNSYLHDHVSLPLAVVGAGCGKLTGNQHLRCAQRTPLANLHLTLLNRAGIPTASFADSTGELAKI